MRLKLYLATMILAAQAAGFARCGFAEPLGAEDLISRAKVYDGRLVAYEGEVIGAVLPRQDHVWLNLYDGSATLGVWISQRLTQEVSAAGGYKHRGDRVLVQGIFHRSCVEHGGGIDIHAHSLRVLRKGAPVDEYLDPRKIVVFFFLTGVTVCLLIIRLLRKRRKEK